MFNAPRTTRQGSQAGAVSPFASFDPLAALNEPDPWSGQTTPVQSNSPAPPSIPGPPVPPTPPSYDRADSIDSAGRNGGFGSGPGGAGLYDEALLPPIYFTALNAIDPAETDSISLPSLHRLLSTSTPSLSASNTEKIVNIVTGSTKTKIGRQEVILALCLVGCVQIGEDASLDSVSSHRLSPITPSLVLSSLAAPTSSSFASPPSPYAPISLPTSFPSSTTDSWPQATSSPVTGSSRLPNRTNGSSPTKYVTGPGSYGLGGVPQWWTKLEKIEVRTIPEKRGGFLNKFTVYEITSDRRSAPVHRRFSSFITLLEILTSRYPFRLLPTLPPKRLASTTTASESWLENRRKGLMRFIKYVVNHPVLKDDAVVKAFMEEGDWDSWRKRSHLAMDEEGLGKRLSPNEEQKIPDDIPEKLHALRQNLPHLIASWTSICTTFERIARRLEAASADASRLNMALNALTERGGTLGNDPIIGWIGERAELEGGVRAGLMRVSEGWKGVAEGQERRSTHLLLTTVEQLRAQRDLYISFHLLFLRYDRLSLDLVDKLRKKVETNLKKIETVKSIAKPGWEVEVDKLAAAIESDNVAIEKALNRRIYIRWCMWNELAYVLHPLENTRLTILWKEFTKEEVAYSENVVRLWEKLNTGIEGMPLEGGALRRDDSTALDLDRYDSVVNGGNGIGGYDVGF